LEEETADRSERHDEVVAEHDLLGVVKLRYIKLTGSPDDEGEGYSRSRTAAAYGLGTNGDHVCMVWKNEAYDMRTGWAQLAGSFGILYGSANVAVQILFPDDCPVKDNTYRDALIRRDDRQRVRVDEFAELVRLNRPQWLLDYITEQQQKHTSESGVSERLKKFLDELQAQPEHRANVSGTGDDEGESSDSTSGSSTRTGEDGDRTTQAGKSALAKGRRRAEARGIPDVRFTTDPALLALMKGRAAYYRRDDNTVFLNQDHFRYTDDLQRLYDEAGEDAERQQLAKKYYDEAYKFRVGCFVVQAWIYKGRADWADSDWEGALKAETLTIHLTSPEALREAQTRFRHKLREGKLRG
jgi:hypothetical protein